MSTCPYFPSTDRAVCRGAGRPYLPSLGEIEFFCCRGGYPFCPIYAEIGGEDLAPFRDELYWLLGPANTA